MERKRGQKKREKEGKNEEEKEEKNGEDEAAAVAHLAIVAGASVDLQGPSDCGRSLSRYVRTEDRDIQQLRTVHGTFPFRCLSSNLQST
ncbi:hypothetical protein CKAN_00462200 [Cinnamomum micranthum f. kanehirae]|uniref:Uncharacterized protein n=1 Tax=Cinnamomum micranthum f. kanehirae TaxID=337451 RepID=A0A3S3Q074_9MAGN|nr:hypothetical protein CKAN_00462200 [Cinnamomum micranthum f. kanehirae]